MKTRLASVFLAAAIVSTVCSHAAEPSGGTAADSQAAAGTSNKITGGSSSVAQVATPVIQPILTVWQQGHTSEAVDLFVHANWAGRPIFPAGMVLGMTEAEFKSLPDSDRQLRGDEMMTQLNMMKQLATVVSNAGQDAASKGDADRARQCYGALKQFGLALDDPKALLMLKMVGQVSVKMADRGLASLGK